MKSILLVKKILRIVEMMSGLVNASFSFPKWKAVKHFSLYPRTYQKCPLRTLEMAFQSEHQD